MTEFTQILSQYRECVRHLWNTYFTQRASDEGFDLVDDFKIVSNALFDTMIANRFDAKIVRDENVTGFPFILVIPIALSPEGTRIYINRPSTIDNNIYWDYPIERVKEGEIELQFTGVFDFDVRGFRDMQYYLTLIRSFPKHPDLVGRKALLEPKDVRAVVCTG